MTMLSSNHDGAEVSALLPILSSNAAAVAVFSARRAEGFVRRIRLFFSAREAGSSLPVSSGVACAGVLLADSSFFSAEGREIGSEAVFSVDAPTGEALSESDGSAGASCFFLPEVRRVRVFFSVSVDTVSCRVSFGVSSEDGTKFSGESTGFFLVRRFLSVPLERLFSSGSGVREEGERMASRIMAEPI